MASITTPPLLRKAMMSWLVLPSWLGSVCAHALLLLTAMWIWQPTERGDLAGDGGDSFRTVGIHLTSGSEGSGANAGTSPTSPSAQQAKSAQSHSVQPQSATTPPSETPIEIPRPSSLDFVPSSMQSAPVIGIASARELGPTPAGALIKSTPFSGPVGDGSGSGSDGASGTGGSSATFGGITGGGKKFVYLIDCSSSMETDRSLRAAKVELLASLQRLDESQQFQVIFYNTHLHPLTPPQNRGDMFQATDSNRLRVEEQIRGIHPSNGTRHYPALLAALAYQPDVIFLLTDGAADTPLEYKDLNEIRKKNSHGTRIHCVEIGSGRESPIPGAANFLRVLSSQNQGKYVYRSTRDILPSSSRP